MELELTRGCINDSLTIDGKEVSDISIDELKNNIVEILGKIGDKSLLEVVLSDIIMEKGEETCPYEPCECCGDYTYIWNMSI